MCCIEREHFNADAWDLVLRLQDATAELRTLVVRRAIFIAAECLGSLSPEIEAFLYLLQFQGVFSDDQVAAARALSNVERANYLRLQEQGGPEEQWMHSFYVSNLLSTMVYHACSEDHVCDIIFDLIMSIEDETPVLKYIESELA